MTDELRGLILATDSTRDSECEDAREKLVPFGLEALPAFQMYFHDLKTWRGRRAIVYTSMKFSRVSEIAREIGLWALSDKSKQVRRMGCMLAAVSLHKDFLSPLEMFVNTDQPDVAEDAKFARIAIMNRNMDLYIDRSQTGRQHLHIVGLVEN